MFELFSITCCVTIVCCVILLFFLYIYCRRMNDSLASSSIGSVYNFRYLQPVTGTYERYLAKVINIRRFTKFELDCLNFHSDYRSNDKDFHRSNTLVTCILPNGDIRNFYAERVIDCNRSIFGGLLFTI